MPICFLTVLQVRRAGVVCLLWFSDLGFARLKSRCWQGAFFSGGSRDESTSKLTGVVASVQFRGVIGLRSHFLAGCWPGFSASRGCLSSLVCKLPFCIFNASSGGSSAVYASIHPDLPFASSLLCLPFWLNLSSDSTWRNLSALQGSSDDMGLPWIVQDDLLIFRLIT